MLPKCGDYFYEDIQKEDENEMVIALGVYFHPELLKDIFLKTGTEWNNRKYVAYKMNVDELLENYKTTLLYYFNHPILFDEEMQLLKIKELLLILSKTENAPTVKHLISSLFYPQEYDFREVIEKNIYATLSLPELAILTNMSIATFKRKFNELYQESPAEYIKKRKLEKAMKLLISNNSRITDIIFDCGFESNSSFNRAFKKKYQLSPTAYRAQYSKT
ncbi:MAG: helix-turn-helix transcriptional regulator [Flavobacteriales bacterium]|nr:helix-turn-helix transcriptional regulator [Flavobacteriales bacterium]